MNSDSGQAGEQGATERAVTRLYREFLDSWNGRDAAAMAALFGEESHLVGFDGSLMNGSREIETVIGRIFEDHETMPYVGKVRDVRLLAEGCALLRAVAGMPQRGQAAVNPAVNTIQSLVAVRQNGAWRIALLQNTPAQFHGRPDLSEALTDELQQLLMEVMKDGS